MTMKKDASLSESEDESKIYFGDSAFGKLLFKVEALDLYSHQAILQFPKSEKFSLGLDIKNCINRIYRLGVASWKKYYKKTSLSELDVEVEVLRLLIRKSFKLHYINLHKYEIWTYYVNEIGKMIGGWIKYEKCS